MICTRDAASSTETDSDSRGATRPRFESLLYGVEVAVVVTADVDRDEPPERSFVDDDDGAAVRAGVAGGRVAGEAELGVVGVEGGRVGDRGAESEESVQAHGASGPVPATHVLRSSPMTSAPETMVSPGAR